MAYRNGTYVAFDGQGTTNPTEGDLKYYGLLQAWNKGKNYELSFSDSHKKTYQVLDSSLKRTLETRLMERMRNSKNMLLIISAETNWDRGMLNYEIEKAIYTYKIPIIVAYTGYEYILDPQALSNRWPKELKKGIEEQYADCIHIPFKEKAIMASIQQFSIHSSGDNVLKGGLNYYSAETYANWGYK